MPHRLLLALAMLSACDAVLVATTNHEVGQANAEVVVEAPAATAVVAKTDPSAPPTAVAAVTVEATLKPESFDLESVNYLVKKGKVKNAAELEKKINNPKEKLNNVDIDGDGKVDKIQVVEIKGEGGASTFELKVIPSKTKDKDAAVVIAFVTFTPDKVTKKLIVKATFAPVVIGYQTIVYTYDVDIEIKGETIVVVDSNPFYGWVFAVSRPAYVGVFVYEVAPPPVIIIEAGGCWPPGHCKHGKHKGKWKGKGKGHW